MGSSHQVGPHTLTPRAILCWGRLLACLKHRNSNSSGSHKCAGSIGARLDGQRECNHVQAAANGATSQHQHARQPKPQNSKERCCTQDQDHAASAVQHRCQKHRSVLNVSAADPNALILGTAVWVHVSDCLHAIASRLGTTVWLHVSSCPGATRQMTHTAVPSLAKACRQIPSTALACATAAAARDTHRLLPQGGSAYT